MVGFVTRQGNAPNGIEGDGSLPSPTRPQLSKLGAIYIELLAIVTVSEAYRKPSPLTAIVPAAADASKEVRAVLNSHQAAPAAIC